VRSQADRQAVRGATYPSVVDYSLCLGENLWGKNTISDWKTLSGAKKEWRSLPLSGALLKTLPITTSGYPLEDSKPVKCHSTSYKLPLNMLRQIGKPKPYHVSRRKPSKFRQLSMSATTWDEDFVSEDADPKDDFDRSAMGEASPLINIRNLTGTILNSQIKLLYFKHCDQHSHTYTAKHISKEAVYEIRVYFFGVIGRKQRQVLKRDCARRKKCPTFLDSWRQGDLVFLAFLVSENVSPPDIKDMNSFPSLTICMLLCY
jgi:hypothetical protein